MRGEFIRGDGVVIPNNITRNGAYVLLSYIAREAVVSGDFAQHWFALVDGFPTKMGVMGDLQEPTLGIGGYARQRALRDATGWPTLGFLGTEAYIETKDLVFPATGDYDKTVTRIAFLLVPDLHLDYAYIALSSPFPRLQITAATPAPQRTFRYRLYWG